MRKRVAAQQRLEPKPMVAVPFPEKPSDRYANDWDNPNRQLNATREASYGYDENYNYVRKVKSVTGGNPGIIKRGR